MLKHTLISLGLICAMSGHAGASDYADTERSAAIQSFNKTLPHLIQRRKQEPRWQVAQDITEKEAFELAKEVGTASAWDAYLIKFPTGFRAAIAKSYLEKARKSEGNSSTQPTTGPTTNTQSAALPPRPGVSYIPAGALPGRHKIILWSDGDQYYNVSEDGGLTYGVNALPRSSSRWTFRQVPGTPFVTIRNAYLRTYLHIRNNITSARSGVSARDSRAHWALHYAGDGSGAVIMHHRTNAEFNRQADQSGYQSFWRLERDSSSDDDDSDEDNYRDTSSIICINGTVRRGKCRCRSGRERTRLSSKRYKCVRKKVAKRTCYEAGCSDHCGPGYVIIRGKCMHAIDAPCRAGYRRTLQGECVRRKRNAGNGGGSNSGACGWYAIYSCSRSHSASRNDQKRVGYGFVVNTNSVPNFRGGYYCLVNKASSRAQATTFRNRARSQFSSAYIKKGC